jgi:hypothetical protein
MASPWKLVKDTRIDLGLVISMVRWATLHMIAPVNWAEKANRASIELVVDLKNKVSNTILEDMIMASHFLVYIDDIMIHSPGSLAQHI